MYDLEDVNRILTNENIRNTLVEYCNWLSLKFLNTNKGKYRIKFNFLYPFLNSPLSDEKRVEFFNEFASCLDISPITDLSENSITLIFF